MYKVILKQRWWVKAAVLIVFAGGTWWLLRGGNPVGAGTTFMARRGDLDISVLEGGSVEALDSQDFKCEVRGYQGVKILKIVEEGYQVTKEDVKNRKPLVELDSSELKKQLTTQEIQFESTVATLTEARQAYDIQLNQNLSDIKAAVQKARFARLDFDKFMGGEIADKILRELGVEADPQPSPLLTNQLASASGSNSNLPIFASAAVPAMPVFIDFSLYATADRLGDGEAKQKIRKFEDDLQLAKKGHSQSVTKVDGTRRLYEKGFLSKSEREMDEYLLQSDQLKVTTATTALDLFLKYEFLKSAEEFLGKYIEAVNELGRARKAAVSKLAQAEAKVKASEGRFNLETRQREEALDLIEKCTIRAKKPGLVVYGGSGSRMYYYGNEQIREGVLVREQQPIITIPDLTHMVVKVKIHETYVKKIQKGQKVRITADAFPDKTLEGQVSKVGVLPDSQNRWVDPDNKVYLTTITIDNVTEWLKPGMSAKTEILVKKLPDVVYVPIQAVTPINGKQYCFIEQGDGQEKREVETGEFNDEFIEIKKGIGEGDRICLRAPPGTERDTGEKDKKPGELEKKPEEPEKPRAAATTAEVWPAGSQKL